MFELKKVPLPPYSRLEDSINSATHAIGAVLSIIGAVLCYIRLSNGGTVLDYFAVSVYLITAFILFAGSAVYHGLNPGFPKQVARVLDHSNVFLFITGNLTAFYLLGVIHVNRSLAIGFCVCAWIVTAVGILLTFMDQEKFKKVQIAMYLIIGWTAVIGVFSLFKSGEAGRTLSLYILYGGILETVGVVFYGIGKKYKYIHAVFHLFVLAGSIIQFIGLYNFMP